MAKWIIGIIVIALAGGALWWSGFLGKPAATPAPAPVATTTPAVTQAAPQPENGMSANNDASDAALSQDAAAIDAQMQGLTTDSASVDAGLGDKSVQ